MRCSISKILPLIFWLCCSLGATAQLAKPTIEELLANPQMVSLITCAPGQEIYSLEGHSGLRIVTPMADATVNWGLFDFAAPNFVYRFVRGETDYMVGIFRTDMMLDGYRREHRRVTEQILNLTPGQMQRIAALVIDNLKPENCMYRYNYVADNCATRPLLMVERAVGDSITLAPVLAQLEQPLTFRGIMRHYHSHYPWYQFGIDICLGSGIDRPLTPAEPAFAPVALMDMVAGGVIHTSSGEIPLVSQTRVLVDFPPAAAVLPPTPWWRTPMAIFILLALAGAFITYRDLRRRRLTAWFDLLLYAMLGITGLIVAFLIFISSHEATSPNYLFLWVNPLCILLAALSFTKPSNKLTLLLQILNCAGMLTYVGIIAAGVQCFNPAFIPILITDAMRAAARFTLK